MTKHAQRASTTRQAEVRKLRSLLAGLEARLYDAATPERERRDLSLEVSIIRARYARALGRTPWTADAALDTDEEE